MDFFKKILNTEDTTQDYAKADIDANKILSLFSYLGILFLIPLLATKGSKFARYHVNQGIILLICAAILGVIIGAVSAIPKVGVILGPILGIIELIPTALAVFGIYNAVTGKAKKLPFIGNLFTIVK